MSPIRPSKSSVLIRIGSVVAVVAVITTAMIVASEPAPEKARGDAASLSLSEIRAKTLKDARAWLEADYDRQIRETHAFLDVCSGDGQALTGSKRLAFVTLAWSGDEEICAMAITLLATPDNEAIDRAKEREVGKWLRRSHGFPLWERRGTPAATQLLLRGLDIHAPQRAAEIRQRILDAQVPPAAAPSLIVRRRKSVDDMTREELIDLAQSAGARSREREAAMRRWLGLDDEEAAAKLLAMLEDENHHVGVQATAAAALASEWTSWGDAARRRRLRSAQAAGIEWLATACTRNLGLGSRPALALLTSGGPAEAKFFELLDRLDGKTLPYPFRYAIAECPSELFFQHVDRFVALENHEARSEALLRIQQSELSKEVLARLLDRLEQGGVEAEPLSQAIAESLVQHPPSDPAARSLAGLWVDLMLKRRDHDLWRQLFHACMTNGLGSRRSAVDAARYCLADNNLAAPTACHVLGEAGEAKDAAAIWKQLQQRAYKDGEPKPSIREVGLLSAGWLAITRLTESVED